MGSSHSYENPSQPGIGSINPFFQVIGLSGFNCNYGNKKVPTMVDSNGVITAPSNYQVQNDQSSCLKWANSTPYNGSLTCGNGTATNSQCTQLYKDLGLSTYANLGFIIDSNVVQGENIIGKHNNSTYTCASFDGKNCLSNSNLNLNMQPLSPLENIVCESNNTPVEWPKNFCAEALDNWGLYPSTNPLVIKERNLNSSIPNTITNQTTLSNLASLNQNYIQNTNTTEGIISGLNVLMEDTPIKLACCGQGHNSSNGSISLSARVPLNPIVGEKNPQLKLFNFERKNLTIPSNACPSNLTPNSPACNSFFDVYCENVINVFNESKLPQSEFVQYAPECACFAPKTDSQMNYPQGTPSICYKDGCSSGTISYLDPTSQGPNAVCDMTICQNIINTSGLKAGGNANINPTLQNNCGQYIPTESSSPIISSLTSEKTNSLIYIIVIVCVIVIIIVIVIVSFTMKGK
jgi:hypothetical protein